MTQEPPSPNAIKKNITLYSEDIDYLNFIQKHNPRKSHSEIIRTAIMLEARRIRAKITRDKKPS